MRAIIADDEPLARDRIRAVLEDEPDVEIVAECADGAQALHETRKLRPDLLFLDVQMPRLNGFEVLQALWPAPIPVVVFATAHDEHAIRAFEVNAVDYLLKPFTEARFKMSLQRARVRLEESARQADPRLKALLDQLHAPAMGGGRILVRSSERILFLKPEEIAHVEAAGNYVVLHSAKEQHILRETISANGSSARAVRLHAREPLGDREPGIRSRDPASRLRTLRAGAQERNPPGHDPRSERTAGAPGRNLIGRALVPLPGAFMPVSIRLGHISLAPAHHRRNVEVTLARRSLGPTFQWLAGRRGT